VGIVYGLSEPGFAIIINYISPIFIVCATISKIMAQISPGNLSMIPHHFVAMMVAGGLIR
jgi:hypothetical protein